MAYKILGPWDVNVAIAPSLILPTLCIKVFRSACLDCRCTLPMVLTNRTPIVFFCVCVNFGNVIEERNVKELCGNGKRKKIWGKLRRGCGEVQVWGRVSKVSKLVGSLLVFVRQGCFVCLNTWIESKRLSFSVGIYKKISITSPVFCEFRYSDDVGCKMDELMLYHVLLSIEMLAVPWYPISIFFFMGVWSVVHFSDKMSDTLLSRGRLYAWIFESKKNLFRNAGCWKHACASIDLLAFSITSLYRLHLHAQTKPLYIPAFIICLLMYITIRNIVFLFVSKRG
jgi:hypothetical protein